MSETVRDACIDLMGLAGLACVVSSAWLISLPAGLLVLGTALLFVAARLARRSKLTGA